MDGANRMDWLRRDGPNTNTSAAAAAVGATNVEQGGAAADEEGLIEATLVDSNSHLVVEAEPMGAHRYLQNTIQRLFAE